MKLIERAGLALLHKTDPENAHKLAINAVRLGLTPHVQTYTTSAIRTNVAGLDLPNPIGLAAGFDKNAIAIGPLCQSGFGFIEIGAVTPRPQPGNPRPRLFRLTEDRAAINRFGFNNDGAEIISRRLEARDTEAGIVGVNLGANKNSEDRAGDFAHVLQSVGPHADFVTVNVSSPNTERLRDLQGKDALAALLDTVMDAHAGLAKPVPVFLKIAPDLDLAQMDDVAEVALASGISGIFATNTTLARDGLKSSFSQEAGGLSGRPLKERATWVLGQMFTRVGKTLPLVGIGGIETAADVLARIEAGASAVQLYTALVYDGLGLADKIARDLEQALVAKGYDNVLAAVGAGHDQSGSAG